jgi:hypothetical protein
MGRGWKRPVPRAAGNLEPWPPLGTAGARGARPRPRVSRGSGSSAPRPPAARTPTLCGRRDLGRTRALPRVCPSVPAPLHCNRRLPPSDHSKEGCGGSGNRGEETGWCGGATVKLASCRHQLFIKVATESGVVRLGVQAII